ncbi:MAG: Maf-like protein YhdE [Chlorobi bacterium]|nr:MAG: septum formation protein [Chlorobi bacterium OLB6]MBV6463595.1 Maf-like protein YhdE [Chlorobiota bacterium]WKZ76725.1 MAG: Maf family protein [Candidatus Kapabacteria bacterium]
MKHTLNEFLNIPTPLVLASQSPRRRQLLTGLGFEFTTVTPSVDEEAVPAVQPFNEYVQTLAVQKARRGLELCAPDSIVIGADTTVVLNNTVLNKPASATDATQMLMSLSGKTHTVYTGLAVINGKTNAEYIGYRSTKVTFRTLLADEIAMYVQGGSPLDKAGGYGIQDDFGAVFVESIHGCYYTVVGLPVELLYALLREMVRKETI